MCWRWNSVSSGIYLSAINDTFSGLYFPFELISRIIEINMNIKVPLRQMWLVILFDVLLITVLRIVH